MIRKKNHKLELKQNLFCLDKAYIMIYVKNWNKSNHKQKFCLKFKKERIHPCSPAYQVLPPIIWSLTRKSKLGTFKMNQIFTNFEYFFSCIYKNIFICNDWNEWNSYNFNNIISNKWTKALMEDNPVTIYLQFPVMNLQVWLRMVKSI